MSLLKGIERCKYISDILDNSNYFIWSKDMSGNLKFANKPAFELFKKLNKNGDIVCPIDISYNIENKETSLSLDDSVLWLRFSSTVIGDDVLIVAKNITDEKIEQMKMHDIINEKILKWQKEEKERSERMEATNKEIFRMLNIMKNDRVESYI